MHEIDLDIRRKTIDAMAEATMEVYKSEIDDLIVPGNTLIFLGPGNYSEVKAAKLLIEEKGEFANTQLYTVDHPSRGRLDGIEKLMEAECLRAVKANEIFPHFIDFIGERFKLESLLEEVKPNLVILRSPQPEEELIDSIIRIAGKCKQVHSSMFLSFDSNDVEDRDVYLLQQFGFEYSYDSGSIDPHIFKMIVSQES